MNILLLEDDRVLSAEISSYLNGKGNQVTNVFGGPEYLKLGQQHFDIYILDINVPEPNGMEVCQLIRNRDREVPILMLTALGELQDKLDAFDAGADDYMVKPFHLDELQARLQALMRRKKVEPSSDADQIIIADLEIHPNESKVLRAGKEILLSPKEYQLLLILASAGGRLVSKQSIAERLWDYNVEASYNTIEVYINFLRKKIDRDFEHKLIQTRPGFGYYIKAEQ